MPHAAGPQRRGRVIGHPVGHDLPVAPELPADPLEDLERVSPLLLGPGMHPLAVRGALRGGQGVARGSEGRWETNNEPVRTNNNFAWFLPFVTNS